VTFTEAQLLYGHTTPYTKFVSEEGQDICEELTETFEKGPPWQQNRHYWELIALAKNLELLFFEEKDPAVTNRALVTFFDYLPQEPEGPEEADAPSADINMDKLGKQARKHAKQLVRDATSMQRFPSSAGDVTADLLSEAKGQLAASLTDADAQDAEGTRGVIALLGALALAAKADPALQSLVTKFERKQALVAKECKRKEVLAAEAKALAAKECKMKEVLAAEATAWEVAQCKRNEAWEVEVEQGALRATQRKDTAHCLWDVVWFEESRTPGGLGRRSRATVTEVNLFHEEIFATHWD
jgi:hypothetical protein